MSQPTHPSALPSSSSLLTATRWLAKVHALGGVVTLGLAGFLVVGYVTSSSDDNLAGVALILGVIYLIVGGVLLGASLGALRARTPGAGYGWGLAAGLLGLVEAGPAITMFVAPLLLGPLVGAVSLALVVCSLVGLVLRSRA